MPAAVRYTVMSKKTACIPASGAPGKPISVFTALCAAALFTLAFPNQWRQLPFCALFLPGAIYWLVHPERSLSQAAFYGWLPLALGAAGGLYWVSVPMHDFAGAPWVAGGAAALLLGSYVGLYGALFGLFCRLVRRNAHPLAAVFGAALAWGGLEWLRGWFMTGFPWLTLSSSLVPWPVFIQGASLFGAYGLSALYAFVSVCLAQGAAGTAIFSTATQVEKKAPENADGPTPQRTAGRRAPVLFSGRGPASLMLFAALALSVFFGIFSYGHSVLNRQKEIAPAWRQVKIGIIQGNLQQDVKWEPSWQNFTVRQYIWLSQQYVAAWTGGDDPAEREGTRSAPHAAENVPGQAAARDGYGGSSSSPEGGETGAVKDAAGPDLLIWPETAIPFYFQRDKLLAGPVRSFARAEGVPLLLGSPAYEMDQGKRKLYNRLVLVDKNGNDGGSYDKVHLVPFGEYIPLDLPIPFATEFLQGYFFTPGGSKSTIEITDFYDKNLKLHSVRNFDPAEARLILGPLICYEAIFPDLAQARVKEGANLLASVSNDAWFGHSPAAEQHLQQAAMRAVEQGRYLARSTNTGISALISDRGEILTRGLLFKPLQLSGIAVTNNRLTIYHELYFALIAAMASLPLLLAGYCAYRSRKG